MNLREETRDGKETCGVFDGAERTTVRRDWEAGVRLFISR